MEGRRHGLSSKLTLTMAVASGVAVANIYYNQPMLVHIARTFGANENQVGWVATATQIGYAVGMPLFVPLGDLVPRRELLVVLFVLTGGSLLFAAHASTLPLLILASVLIGATSVVAQVMIPFASDLSRPDRAGKTVGSILSGVLIGILLARTVSGFVSEHFSWRVMFTAAAVAAFLFAVVLRFALPATPRRSNGTYAQLMHSIWSIVRDTTRLRQVAAVAALFFAAFSAFWTTLVFFLGRPPYHYGSQAAGLFGLIGVVGSAVAPLAGRLSDTHSPRYVVRWAIATVLLSFLIFWVFGTNLWALIAGVILLDAGIQAAQVANQTRVMGLRPDARSRANTFYMLCYFGGGSLGSLIASHLWSAYGWSGVCAAGVAFMLLAIVVLVHRGPERAPIH